MNRFTVFVLAFCISVGVAGEASAHAHLTSAIPAADSTTASPTELALTFSEGLNLKFSGIDVSGPDKAKVATGKASLKAGDDTTLVVPLSGNFAPGAYKVNWHALSVDGHKTNGTYQFTVK